MDPCPYGDRSEPPDLARARQLVEDAGQVDTVVTVGIPPELLPRAAARYFTRTLRKIGLAARAQPTTRGAALRLELLAPPIAHPSAFLAAFRGETGDLELDRTLEELLADPDTPAEDWAEVDERLVEEAYVAPLGAGVRPAFYSERIDVQGCASFHPVFGTDLASLCLR
jgi:hypothetical protein